jgi:hypothetical protein
MRDAPRDAGLRVHLRNSLIAIGIGGLCVLGIAYWLTYEPAPRIRVLWRPGVTQEQQAALERRYLLVNGRDRLPEGSVAYDLLDISTRNVKAIVDDPAIVDTNDIERHTYVIPFETQYGDGWMWMAHRIPRLRESTFRRAVIGALALMALAGLAMLKTGRPTAR